MELDYLGIVFRWLHMLPAIAAVGGMVFMRFALLPAMATLPEAERSRLQEAVRSRWAMVVMLSILLLLGSGLYNIYVIESQHKVPETYERLYRGLFGLKFLLGFVIFFISSALVGRSEALAGVRRNARFWLSLNLTLAVVLILISGVLRLVRDRANIPAEPAETAWRQIDQNTDQQPSDHPAAGVLRT